MKTSCIRVGCSRAERVYGAAEALVAGILALCALGTTIYVMLSCF